MEAAVRNGSAEKYLEPKTWWGLTGRLTVQDGKAYFVSWVRKTELGDVAFDPETAKLIGTKVQLANHESSVEFELGESYSWVRADQIHANTAIGVSAAITLVTLFFFASKTRSST